MKNLCLNGFDISDNHSPSSGFAAQLFKPRRGGIERGAIDLSGEILLKMLSDKTVALIYSLAIVLSIILRSSECRFHTAA